MTSRLSTLSFAIILLAATGIAHAQTPYPVGQPLGVAEAGGFAPMSDNVTVYGGIVSAESCVYDPERQLILLMNMGVRLPNAANDAWVSKLHPDGSLHTARWIGVQPPQQRSALSPPLTLNDPFGSEIAGGVLYVADSDGGMGPDDPRVAVIRRFDLHTGARLGDTRIEDSPWINDIAVDRAGNVYSTQSGDFGPDADPDTWRVYRTTPAGVSSIVLAGAPLKVPNGIAFDRDSNLVVVNYGDSAVVTVTPSGKTLRTEYAAQPGGDGIVVMPDGTKYVSSVTRGGISRLRAGEPSVLIASGIPGAASMCLDVDRQRLVVPMTSQSGVGFVSVAEADAGADAAPVEPIAAELLRLSRDKWRWMANKDTARLAGLFHPQAQFVHMGGTWGRARELAVIGSGGIHYKRADIEEASVEVLGEDQAVVYNRIKLLAVVGANEVTNPFMVTEVYRRGGEGRWQLATLAFSRLLER